MEPPAPTPAPDARARAPVRSPSGAAAAREPPPVRDFPHTIPGHVAHVQKGRGVVLDRRGGGPVQGHERLGALERQRAPFHQARAGLFRRQRRHRQRESGRAFRSGGAGGRGAVLLRLSDRHGERALGNVFDPHRHVRALFGGEAPFVERHRDDAVRQREGRVGAALDRRQRGRLRRAPGGLRGRRGRLLFGQFRRHILAQETRPHARPDFQQRAHLQGRGSALRLCLFAVQAFGAATERGARQGDRHRRGRHRAALPHRSAAGASAGAQLRNDVAIHRVRRRQAAARADRRQALQHAQPAGLYEPHLLGGENQFFRKKGWRVSKIWRHVRQTRRVYFGRRLLNGRTKNVI
nr:ORF120 Ld-RNR-R2b [Lymantria dispar multiple nucleopolyhedrovirus]